VARTGYRASVALTRVPGASTDSVSAVVSLDPPDAAVNANWFDVTVWQGGSGTWGGGVQGLVIRQFHELSPGIYRSEGSFPVGGNWKALIRLHTGNSIEAVPVFLPADPAIPAPEVPAKANFTRSFVPDKHILQREATGGSPLVQNIAYVLCGLIAVVWVASLGWGLHRLETRRRPVTIQVMPSHEERFPRAG
ncbi:MAG TPA: hypothetical protein VNN79_14135, partial [Actinomycetota bacterium]|nr:hypothetical protein [Actinomycetota bacterium]